MIKRPTALDMARLLLAFPLLILGAVLAAPGLGILMIANWIGP